MALRCASVIRGGKKPLVVELTSNCADAFGVVVPIPVWDKAGRLKPTNSKIKIFFMGLNLLVNKNKTSKVL